MTTEERVQQKAREYCRAEARLTKLYEELGLLQLQGVKEKYGVYPGGLVCAHGEQYKIHAIITTFYPNKPWLLGQRRLPSGRFSGVIKHLYAAWELVPAKEV